MPTTVRLLSSTVLVVTAIGLGAPGAHARDHESLEVYPSTAAPGAIVTVHATACGGNGHGVGDVRSLGAGEFHLAPGTYERNVVGQFRVPRSARSGTYGLSVLCNNGERVTGDIAVRSSENRPGSHSDKNQGESGSYDSGGGESGNSHGGSGGNDPADYSRDDVGGLHHQQPSGHVQTGVGGSVGPDTTQIATGVAVLAMAAAGGTLLLRRRASGAQGS
ncbi:hypothetical protein [Streptomyces jumonjinensis]|uniref:hypothetical protein n=1 Tax=Streptomyces jumonjinensis TaxID=1945 RepID=UPI0037872C86